jgi:drug/metabolite transporter (DMT)-like permease
MESRKKLHSSLLLATFAVSWAAILIRLAGAGPLPTAFYRVAMASLVLVIPAIPHIRRAFNNLTGKQIFLLFLSGIFLGLHFAAWVTSLFYTSVSNSTIIVSTQPIFLLILESYVTKSKIPLRAIFGMILALIGMFLISGGDYNLGNEYLYGDLLALAGAFLAGMYLFIGRQLRAKIDNLGYIVPVYATAAITLLIACIISGQEMIDYPGQTWVVFLLLALIPTVIGHSLYNWLLKYLPAHKVAMAILGEPIGATILAIIILSQIPAWTTILGGIIILFGIYVVLKRNKIDKLHTESKLAG